jgi:hypothetical protein
MARSYWLVVLNLMPDHSLLTRNRNHRLVLAIQDLYVGADLTDLLTQHGTRELRFPPFHSQILQQAQWDAGESLGRIKIALSEGVVRGSSSLQQGKVRFERVRDIVVFSFQHAPQRKCTRREPRMC